jgi:hypothetical protein
LLKKENLMEIGKPQINIPKGIQEEKLEQASAELQAESPGFAKEDLLEAAPDHHWQQDFNMAESFGPPEVPHPSLHGQHFELGRDLRAAFSPPDNGFLDDVSDDFENGILPSDPDAPSLFDTTVKDAVKDVDRIVENLKDQIQDSVESAIHPFEDWFD